jgi:hypothetical protein
VTANASTVPIAATQAGTVPQSTVER